MESDNLALLTVTDETLQRYSTAKPERILFIISDSPTFLARSYREIPEEEFVKMIPGKYFGEGILGMDMFVPRTEDLLYTETIGKHTFLMSKLCFCFGQSFDDRPMEEYQELIGDMIKIVRRRYEQPEKTEIQRFIMDMFKNDYSVRGATIGRRVYASTPCCDFFHADVDGIDGCISGPIEAAFGLEQFHFKYGLSSGGFRSYIKDPLFRVKYPAGLEGTTEFTLRLFIDMVYDLTLIKYGLPMT